jgi:hypothetical protein
VGDPWDSWLRLPCTIHNYWTGDPYEIDDRIFLTTTGPPFGGLRWWFVCPRLSPTGNQVPDLLFHVGLYRRSHAYEYGTLYRGDIPPFIKCARQIRANASRALGRSPGMDQRNVTSAYHTISH